MSKYGEYIKSMKEKEIKFFFGEDAENIAWKLSHYDCIA